MILSIGFFLQGDDEKQNEITIGLIAQYLKIRVRCYLFVSSRKTDNKIRHELLKRLKTFPSQYCIVKEEAAVSIESLYHGVLRSDYLKEMSSLNLIVFADSSISSIFADKLKVPCVCLEDIQKNWKRSNILQTAAEVLANSYNHTSKQDRYAIFDVGTNNVLLVWAAIVDKNFKIIHRASAISALGKNMRQGRLTKAGLERTKRVLCHLLGLTRYFTERIVITGTSCSRESSNINVLIDWLKSKYSIDYRILSEAEETELVGLANRKMFGEFDKLILFDVGGGSTEFVYYRKDKIVYLNSLKLGIRRLENLSKNDLNKKIAYIRQTLQGLPKNLLEEAILVGIGGTVTNISAVKKKLYYYDSEAVHKSILGRDDIEYYLKTFAQSNLTEIAALMPFEPLRAGVITTGLLIIREIMDYFGKKSIYVSDYGLQFGILQQVAGGSSFS